MFNFVILKVSKFLFILLLSNFFVVSNSSSFVAYWNIPTYMCKKYGINFENLYEDYGIVQNSNDSFRGSKVTILYDPGNFPALLTNTKSGNVYRRNGGIPTEGNLTSHLLMFEKHMNELIVDPHFDGIGIIDMESWRPVWRQNWGAYQIYKDVTIQIEKDNHKLWSTKQQQNEAARKWEKAAPPFMIDTIQMAKALRPKALWGYYAYPYCFNNDGQIKCSAQTIEENNKMDWLWKDSDLLMPSVYLSSKLSKEKVYGFVAGRVREAKRISKRRRNRIQEILTYYRYVYSDSRKFLSESDMLKSLQAMKAEGSDGIILWGSSFDLDTRQKCFDFSEYMKNSLGPAIRSFVQQDISVKNYDFWYE